MLSQNCKDSELPRGLDAIWDKATGFIGRMVPIRRRYLHRATRIVGEGRRLSRLTDRKLKAISAYFHEGFKLGRATPDDRDRAFALVSEVSARTVGMRPYPVQVAGALAIEAGTIAEMATGEGKTLVATMPAVLAGWRGRGCHVMTSNEYLAGRDAALMAPIYEFCGLNVSSIRQEMTPTERRHAYHAPITYCTSHEATADFLRDQLTMGKLRGLTSALLAKAVKGSHEESDRLVQRGLECAIVDEADSVLIDEAVTPLIISGQGPNEAYVHAHEQACLLAGKLDPSSDYGINNRYREIRLTEPGKQRLAELAAPLGGPWAGARRREELAVQALVARQFFIRDEQYIVHEGKVVIVDEFTGRPMPDRTWRDGLHQAVEAKEGLEISLPNATLARISFQRFFRLYRKLSGMTGTGIEARAEFWQIYHLPIVAIPTNRPGKRVELSDRVFTSGSTKWKAVVDEVRKIHETGRPILIGTRSIWASEHLSNLLASESLDHQVLNAVHHKKEARIVADAGRKGAITVATNMAGRGTDICLGRSATELGGLHVIATERHEAGRIDRQLFGRCSRQGDPGSAQTFVSLEDELAHQHARLRSKMLARRHGQNHREITSRSSQRLMEVAQRRAERAAIRQRENVLHTDNWLEEHLGFAGKEF